MAKKKTYTKTELKKFEKNILDKISEVNESIEGVRSTTEPTNSVFIQDRSEDFNEGTEASVPSLKSSDLSWIKTEFVGSVVDLTPSMLSFTSEILSKIFFSNFFSSVFVYVFFLANLLTLNFL